MPLKQTILDDISREQWEEPPAPLDKYASEKDTYILEDESGRVKLTGNFDGKTLCTGMIIGVLGSEALNGVFNVVDVCFPIVSPQKPIGNAETCWIAFVSGLEFSNSRAFTLQLDLLADFITGQSDFAQDLDGAASIVRLVVCGNLIAESQKAVVTNKFGTEEAAYDPLPISNCDEWLGTVCTNTDVDVMPGPQDPASLLFPQQPVHRSMFQRSSMYSSFHSVTNPYAFETNGVTCIATAGQNIDAMYQYTQEQDRMHLAETTLQCAHLAPLAPDSLWCHPFKDDDPFILDRAPHIYVAGNQPQYSSKLYEDDNGNRCRIVLLPRFSQSGTMVMVNTQTLQVRKVSFGDPSMYSK